VKETTSPSLAFSADGRWLAVVGQQGAVDCVSIFSTSWDLKKVNVCIRREVLTAVNVMNALVFVM
jgi:hypothetical protein